MKTLNELWLDYRNRCYPAGCPADQNREVHQAFFCGALTMFGEITAVSALTDAAAEARLAALEREVTATCAARAMNLGAQN